MNVTVDQSRDSKRRGSKTTRFALCPLVSSPGENMKWLNLFGRLKSVVIGMIHVKALPGMLKLVFFVGFFFLLQSDTDYCTRFGVFCVFCSYIMC